MGRIVGSVVASVLEKSLLELGGNNAIIITPDLDLDITIIGAFLFVVGTCGQRCTSTRRLIVHESLYNEGNKIIKSIYPIENRNPLDGTNHVGPLIDKDAVNMYLEVMKTKKEGGAVLVEGEVLKDPIIQVGVMLSL